MREFNSLASFAGFLGGLTVAVEHARHEALEEAAKVVEKEAKDVLGTHDYDWPPLKPETIAIKATGDSPLLETGKMRDSIGHTVVSREEAHVGSDEDTAVFQELGTVRIPPRSFLAQAAIHKEEDVRHILGRRSVSALIGSSS